MHTLFGTDGIRGPALQGILSPEALTQLGQAISGILKGSHHQVLVGMDPRQSGPAMKEALVTGLMKAGMHVIDVGIVSTPCLAFLTQTLDVDFSIMISASHNPYTDNGLKIFGPGGTKLAAHQESGIESCFHEEISHSPQGPQGKLTLSPDLINRYIIHLITLYKGLDLSSLTLAFDCAHGSLSQIVRPVLETFGARVHLMGHEPDGMNINDQVGATHPQALQNFMTQTPAHLGFSFDGDGDRVMTFLANGHMLDGDQMLCLLAQSWQAEGKLTLSSVVSTVMANHSLKTTLNENRIELTQSAVGDKYVSQTMEETGAQLGGESSGHMILKPLSATGDGLLTALELLRIHMGMKPLAAAFTPCPQLLHNVRVNNKKVLQQAEWVDFYKTQVESLEGEVSCLIRPSGTESLIRIMLQGNDVQALEKIAAHFSDKIKALDHATSH